jgi:hypothetical protein
LFIGPDGRYRLTFPASLANSVLEGLQAVADRLAG